MKIKIGDKIKIYYYIENSKIEDYITITLIDNNYLYTCGHCFPKNAKTKYGTLLYSSGFDEPSEGQEIAKIKIYDSKLHLFNNVNISNNFVDTKDNIKTVLINNRKKYRGIILSQINKKLKKGVNIINDYKIDHTITKLNEPYYLVKIIDDLDDNGNYNFGLSGSPWIVYQNGLKLLGGHIGRTYGKDPNGNNIIISYVKPIKN